jgi:hypothetical protein
MQQETACLVRNYFSFDQHHYVRQVREAHPLIENKGVCDLAGIGRVDQFGGRCF